ncbi:MAG: polymer-forming cytoskeletal protein [Myxococcota bacterium]|jgi:cytoskeletal protein CcmA (bactofilin family)|nr:polymer-forming cytoskeletal protein [Myxococcota bacterium]
MTQITHTLLGPDASFEGKLEFEGDVRIDGRFRGEIVSNDRLIIGEGAVVYGNVQVGTLVLNGNLEGQVHVRESAELQAGRLVGELYAGSLQVAKGVILDGVVHMLNTSPSEPAIQHSASETLTASDY